MRRSLTFVFACTTLVLAASLAWALLPNFPRTTNQSRSDDIVFPIKTFVGTKAYVGAKGTLVADWIAYKNNTVSILCVPDECITAEVDQIGRQQISSIDGPVVYRVKRWTDDDEVVAEDDALCARITITLDRRTEGVLWVETPINQAEIACKSAGTAVRKATLEASLYYRRNP